MKPNSDSTAPINKPDPSNEAPTIKLDEIKRHVVQLEVITLSTILFVVLSYLLPSVEQLLGATAASLLPFGLLTAIPWLAPVVNPEDDTRSRIKWGLSGLGAGGLIGNAIGALIYGPFGTPVGTLVGGLPGFVAGCFWGPAMDGRKKIFTQGEAREYLFEKRKKYPSLRFEDIIAGTLHPPSEDKNIQPIRMFLSDGVVKCIKEEVDLWLEKAGWEKRFNVLSSNPGK